MSSGLIAYVFTSFSLLGFTFWLLNWVFRRRIQYSTSDRNTLRPLSLKRPLKFQPDPSKSIGTVPKYKFFQKHVSPVSSLDTEDLAFIQTIDPSVSEILDKSRNLVNKRLMERARAASDSKQPSKLSDDAEMLRDSRERVLAMWSVHNTRSSHGTKQTRKIMPGEDELDETTVKKSFPAPKIDPQTPASAAVKRKFVASKNENDGSTAKKYKSPKLDRDDSVTKKPKTSRFEQEAPKKVKPSRPELVDSGTNKSQPSKLDSKDSLKKARRDLQDPTLKKSRDKRDLQDPTLKKSRDKRDLRDPSVKKFKDSKLDVEDSLKKSRARHNLQDSSFNKSKDKQQFSDPNLKKSKASRPDADYSLRKSKTRQDLADPSLKNSKPSKLDVQDSSKRLKDKRVIEDLALKKSKSSKLQREESSKKSKLDLQGSGTKKPKSSKPDSEATKTKSKTSKPDLVDSEKKSRAAKSSSQKLKKDKDANP